MEDTWNKYIVVKTDTKTKLYKYITSTYFVNI